jgi:hypothetical protein
MGVTASLIGVVAVFLCNIAITIWVWKRPNSTIQDSMEILFQGDCARAPSLNVWIHSVVNAFSTLLLAASNFCLQVLSAPSPKDLARAHEKRQRLQIGLPSLRNLWRIGKDRTFLCVVLLLSSVPLHLLFNSVPVARTCSAIISAACHGPLEERDAALFPVQWGVVPIAYSWNNSPL